MPLALALAAASLIWIGALAAASAAGAGDAFLPASIRAFAATICHQQPDRSFFWGAAPWAVCARCLGLYVAAPAGALAALAAGGSRAFSSSSNLRLLSLAGAPTLLTWLAEVVFGLPMTNVARFAAALPLGAAAAWVLVRTALDARPGRVSQYTLGDARRGPTR